MSLTSWLSSMNRTGLARSNKPNHPRDKPAGLEVVGVGLARSKNPNDPRGEPAGLGVVAGRLAVARSRTIRGASPRGIPCTEWVVHPSKTKNFKKICTAYAPMGIESLEVVEASLDRTILDQCAIGLNGQMAGRPVEIGTG